MRFLSKVAFRALVLLASIFFIEHYGDIVAYFKDFSRRCRRFNFISGEHVLNALASI